MLDTCKCSILDLNDFGSDSVLCYPCLQKLGKWAKHEKEIVEIKEQITTFLQRFISVRSRKRVQPTEVDENTTESHTPLRKKSKKSQRNTDASKVSVSILFAFNRH